MPNPHFRRWTEDDNAKLKSLAGKMPATRLAKELGRSAGATVQQACKLKVSLRTRPHTVRAAPSGIDAAQAGNT
jgi:hypothetical protein